MAIRPQVIATGAASGGVHIPMFWWIVIAIVAFLILRAVLRVFSAQRSYGGPGTPPAGAPRGAEYGPGYGYGGYGGGGSFWSGLLGGLGGAWLGNELFRGGGIAPVQPGQLPSDTGVLGANDSGGWQNDGGQADIGAASSGDWSGSGDIGGGGDFSGVGGDSGGGW